MKIAKTSIHTPSTGKNDLDLCNGESLTTLKSLDLGWNKTFHLFDIKKSIFHVVQINATTYGGLELGLCGPSWALYLEAEGTVDDSTGDLALKITDDQAAAGFFAGLIFSLTLDIGVDVFKVTLPHCHWEKVHCHWHGWHLRCSGGLKCHGGGFSWDKVLEIEKTFPIDPVKIILNFLLGRDKKGPDDKVVAKGKSKWPSKGQMSMTAAAYNKIAKNAGTIELTPKYPIQINLLDFFEPWKPLEEVLKKADTSLKFGPEIDIDLPTKIELVSVATNLKEYKTLAWKGDTVSGSPTGNSTVDKDDLQLTFKQTTSIDFSLGVFANITILKYVSIPISLTFDVSKLLGLSIPAGDHHVPLQGKIPTATANGLIPEPVDVIFHDPEETKVA